MNFVDIDCALIGQFFFPNTVKNLGTFMETRYGHVVHYRTIEVCVHSAMMRYCDDDDERLR